MRLFWHITHHRSKPETARPDRQVLQRSSLWGHHCAVPEGGIVLHSSFKHNIPFKGRDYSMGGLLKNLNYVNIWVAFLLHQQQLLPQLI